MVKHEPTNLERSKTTAHKINSQTMATTSTFITTSRQSHRPHSKAHRKSPPHQESETTSSSPLKRRVKLSSTKTTLLIVSAVFLLVLLIPIIPDKRKHDQNRRQLRSMDERRITESSDYTAERTGTRKMAIIPKYVSLSEAKMNHLVIL